MPTVTLWLGSAGKAKAVEARVGANLLQVIVDAGLPIGRSCDGVGVCAKCGVRVVAGAENLSRPTALERTLMVRESLPEGTRLACLTKVLGAVTISAPYW